MIGKRALKVFLSYAHADGDAVKDLYHRLKSDGVDVWLDTQKLLPGQDWELEIRRAVREADVVVVCLSCHFREEGFRQKEVRIALEEAASQPEGTIFIIPARLEKCESLQSLEQWHWVDLFEEDGYEKLLRALQKRADSLGAKLQSSRSSITKAESSVAPKTKEHKSIKTEYIVAFIGAIATLIGGILSSPVADHWFPDAPTSSATATFTELATFTPIVHPSDTFFPIATLTETVPPTVEPTFTQMITSTATFTPRPTDTVTISPSSTATPLPAYACVTIQEQPPQGSNIHRGKHFKIQFRLKNTGTATWPYDLDMILISNPSGIFDPDPSPIKIPRVHPGDSQRVTLDVTAPYEDGPYVINFKLGDGICWPSVAFKVVK